MMIDGELHLAISPVSMVENSFRISIAKYSWSLTVPEENYTIL